MEDRPFEIGKANIVRQGDDLTIIGCGIMVATALDAAAALAEEGIEARVLDMHTIRPMDIAAIVAAARETGAIVIRRGAPAAGRHGQQYRPRCGRAPSGADALRRAWLTPTRIRLTLTTCWSNIT